ncbi:hypothetical protein COOONC_21571 [Cooperia oncophora]
MRGFVLCFLAIGVTSAASSTGGPGYHGPIEPSHQKTASELAVCSRLVVADPIVHFTEQEKQQLLNFVNKCAKGEINVTNKEQLLSSLQKKLGFADAASFAQQFPEISHFLVAAPAVQELRKFADKLPDNSTAYNVGSF